MNQPIPVATPIRLAERFRHGANWIQCAAQDVTRAIDSIGTRSMVPPGDVEAVELLTVFHQQLAQLEGVFRTKADQYLARAKEKFPHADVQA